jgi:hypothetical protein
MRCKNASMGCLWKGQRKDLDHHIAAHCLLERVGGFVDQFRHTRADHEAAILQLQQRQVLSNQLLELHGQLMRKSTASPYNVFDLLNLIYTATCTTPHFLVTADAWRPFLVVNPGSQESRAAVCNLLYLLPTFVNVCRVSKSPPSRSAVDKRFKAILTSSLDFFR